jgi:lysylphosphatidylglycerol synthetase-like protein (DUF2156 family)
MEETTTSTEPTLFQNALRWGLIMAAVSIVLTITLYAVDYSMLADWKTGILMILIFISITIYAGINYRNQIGGFLPFGKAFQHGFVVMAICGIVSTVFMILMYTVIDPELPQKLTDASIEKAEAMMESFGLSGDAMDKALEDARKRSEGQFSAFGAIKGYGIGLIVYAIVALITSLFVKKNQPEVI